jgi:putative transposase
MVTQPADYRWSSYRCNAHGLPDALSVPHSLYTRLGTEDLARQAAYRDLFRVQLEGAILEEIREATNKAWALGSEHFVAEMEKLLDRRARPAPRGGDCRSAEFIDM